MGTKQWHPKPPPAEWLIEQLRKDLTLSDTLLHLIAQRNINSITEARNFFLPELSQLNNPMMMKDMRAAITHIHQCIEEGKKILVYGDYDVDGEAAVVCVYSFIKKNP